MSSPHPRIKIRCPNCQNDGSARAELLGRRVSCKHCSHVFRVVPVEDGPSPVPATAPAPAPVPVPTPSKAPSKASVTTRGDESLQARLDKALKAVVKAEAREAALRKERDRLRDQADRTLELPDDENKVHLLEEELRGLRDQLDKAKTEVEAETRKRQETAETLESKTLEHAQAIGALERELETIRLEHQARAETVEQSTGELASLREQLEQARAEMAALQARLVEAEATRTHRDQLASDLEGLQGRFADAERATLEHKASLEAARLDREQAEAASLAELADLREQLARALSSSADASILRQELEEIRSDRDRSVGELEALREKVADAERREADWGYPSTELELPQLADPYDPPTHFPDADDRSTVFDPGPSSPSDEPSRLVEAAETLRQELADLTDQMEQREAEAAETLERARAEAKDLRRTLYDVRLESEKSSKMVLDLADVVRRLESQAASLAEVPEVPTLDLSVFEAERKQAVDVAVKAAWADFERRLAETHEKLQAANARADLMEAEARDARDQIAGRAKSLDLIGDASSFGGEVASATSVRILDARGTARLTPADAEARLGLARQLAVDRKDKALIDRVSKMTEKVKADLEARNYTLAETLVRGAEIETGLDPGGFSINGMRIFRASPTIVGNLAALAPSFDRVMRDGELEAVQTTIDELKTILGDQAGLPEIRRPGRTPETKRPIGQPEAFRLFIDALVAESWLVRPVVQKKPLPDTALGTYASLVEATCLARKFAPTIDPEQVSFLDEIIQAACLMLTRRQQPDGHFAFLDPRGKTSKAATIVDGMVAQRSDAVKDGWVVHVDPIGLAQAETGPCGVALATAGNLLGREEWVRASQKAAEWAVGQPCLPSFVANAASLSLLARSYLDTQADPYLVGLVRKLHLGLLPGQSDNGRWLTPDSATTANHLLILRALHDAWEAIPQARKDVRSDLEPSIDRAFASLLEECKALGVPSQGGALRDLIRHQDLFPDDHDPRIEAAILDSATVIQELCHDGPRPRLGVAPDQLAALIVM